MVIVDEIAEAKVASDTSERRDKRPKLFSWAAQSVDDNPGRKERVAASKPVCGGNMLVGENEGTITIDSWHSESAETDLDLSGCDFDRGAEYSVNFSIFGDSA
jgi:hypothetical protein